MSRTTTNRDRTPAAPDDGTPPWLDFGEVRTCLIQNLGTLSPSATVALMQLTPGSPVSKVDRPVRRVVSPEQVTGVDCRLQVAREGRGRAIGTVLSHAVVTNGRILQGTAMWRSPRRPPRSAASGGTTCGTRVSWRSCTRRTRTTSSTAIWPTPRRPAAWTWPRSATASSTRCSRATHLNHTTALRASTAVVRWAATLAPDTRPTVGIAKSDVPNFHVIRLSGAPDDLPMLIRFCEEFALHEWLLTTVQDVIVRRAETDIARDRDPLDSLLFASTNWSRCGCRRRI